MDEALDRNLDDMASGLARLKGLAQGLNSELSDHNQILDRWVMLGVLSGSQKYQPWLVLCWSNLFK